MTRLLRQARLWYGLGLLIADAAFFSMTNPERVASIGLMSGFLLLAASLYYLANLVLAAGKLYGIPFGRHRQRLALLATAVTAGLLALQSIGQLSLHDAFVLGPLAIVAYVYLGYARTRAGTVP